MLHKRRPLLAGNWKMNGFQADGTALAADLAKRMQGETDPAFDMLICPPYTLIVVTAQAIQESAIALGAQDCHAAAKGAHTGDISAAMLADLGCRFVIVGHSERRTDHGETDVQIITKAQSIHAAGLTAVICIGETEDEKDAGKTLDVVKTQLTGSVPADATAANTVIAYEPVWAIGTGRTPTNEEVQEVHAFIRAELTSALGDIEAEGIRVLYGGSMKPENAKDLIQLTDVDGGLIGGASLKAEDFWAIAQSCSE